MAGPFHELKCWPSYFEALAERRKLFEMRFNDRDYQKGDILHEREWQPAPTWKVNRAGNYTGRSIKCLVTYVLRDSDPDDIGLTPEFVPDGWCIMGLRIIEGTYEE